jgi:DNA polymerase sigma
MASVRCYPALTADIVAFAAAASPSDDESSRRATALEVITAAVKKEWPGAEVSVFGSAACGTTLPSSDIDVAVNGTQWNPPPPDATATATAATAADAANLAIKPAMIRGARRLADRLRAMVGLSKVASGCPHQHESAWFRINP